MFPHSLDFSISSLAEHFHTSVLNMSHLFKYVTGIGYKQYVDYLRVERAKTFLENTGMTIGEIAESCGYISASSFIRTYKKLTGQPPRYLPAETKKELSREKAVALECSRKESSQLHHFYLLPPIVLISACFPEKSCLPKLNNKVIVLY
ncbi:MAG: helix-turn-helix transcriptional regulator [Neglectibacter timonensis]|uniref:helix-turn-helix transcriptional regulator n=1 Tax=Neglectibacter timonensis TaxID=1776382 RepID=UPI0039928286